MSIGTPWTEDRQLRLIGLAELGWTATEIGRDMQITRNAVLGRAHRTGVKLPLTEGKLAAMDLKRQRPGKAPRIRKRRRATRAFPDAEVVVAIAAHLAGQSLVKSAALIGASAQSLGKNWLKQPALVDAGRELFERAKADAAQRAAAKAELKAFAVEAERQHRERNNAPILARMSERDRRICEARIQGETLRALAPVFGVTFERVRQIEVKWRLRGLIVPGARPITDAGVSRFGSKEPKRRQPKHPRPVVDFWAEASKVNVAKPNRRPFHITEAERERRRAWGRQLGAMRHGASA